MLFGSFPRSNDPWTFLLAGLTGCIIHCGPSCRLAFRVYRPLKEDEQQKDTRK